MAQHREHAAARTLESLPPLPLDDLLWSAVVKAMRLSPTQAKIVELTLRDACNKQIAAALQMSLPTLRTHQDRIAARTGTHGRMQLAMCVLAHSHEVNDTGGRRPNG